MAQPFNPREQLRRQLGFLERSCDLFDQGFQDEAMRIATVARTLFRDTFRREKPLTVSLLTHMEKETQTAISLLSSVKKLDSVEPFAISRLTNTRLTVRLDGSYECIHQPHLRRTADHGWFASRQEWWEQAVYMNGSAVTRKDLVLAAAEQDGGVHVDSEVSEAYDRIRVGFIKVVVGDGQPVSILNAHLTDLRQIGYELLCSPELLDLAT